MADTKISALTAATTPLAGTEVAAIVQGGETRKVAVSNIGGGSFAPSIGQVSNTDTSTDLNSNGTWTQVPITGTTVIMDSDDFGVSGNGIECNFSGRVEATAVLYLNPSNNTRRIIMTLDIDGTPIGPNVICTQARNTAMLMSAAINHIVSVSADEVIGIMTQKADGFGPCPMASSGTSFLTLKRLS